MHKKTLCFIRSGRVETIAGMNKLLYEHFSNEFERVYFVDVSGVFTSSLRYGSLKNNEKYKLLPENFEVIVPKNMKEFKKFLKNNNIVVISAFSEEWYDWYIHYYLKKYSIPIVYIHIMSPLMAFQYKRIPFARIVNKFKSRYLSIRIFRTLFFMNIIPKVDTLFTSQRINESDFKKSNRYSEAVVTNSRFYDSFLKNKYGTTNEYVVFLDSMLPYHGDQLRYGYNLIDKNLYYKNLNRVFDIVETKTKKEIIICLHPKYDDANIEKDYGSRRTVKYRTDEFISKAELVLFHNSSAINSAIIYNKKVIQLAGSQFNGFIINNCKIFQKFFSFATIDIYEDQKNRIEEIVENVKINSKNYNEFLSNYLMASGSKGAFSSKQITDKLIFKYKV